MLNKISSEYLYFVFSRIVALLIKPLFLWLLLKVNFIDTANIISIFYLTLSSVMVIFNNEAHFNFYKNLFEFDNIKLKNLILQRNHYYERLIHHILIFSGLTFVLTYILSANIYYSIIFFVILIAEKFFDEIQRILQFKKKFKEWSIIFIIKSLVPLTISMAILIASKNELAVILSYLFSNLIVTVIIISYKTSNIEKQVFLKILRDTKIKSLINYFKVYKNKLFLNQLQSFSTRNIPLTDRLIFRFLMPEFLAQISIISQLGSICIMFIDYFLIAHRRKEYLSPKKNVFDLISIKKLMLFLVASFITYLIIIISGLYFGFINEMNLSFNILFIIGIYYSIFAISQHFAQYNFWNIKRKYTLSVDLVYYIMVLVLFMLLSRTINFYYAFSITLLVSHLIRLSMSILISFSKKCEYVSKK